MRIAELAVPTKRQCMETLRNKSDMLPVYMVRSILRKARLIETRAEDVEGYFRSHLP